MPIMSCYFVPSILTLYLFFTEIVADDLRRYSYYCFTILLLLANVGIPYQLKQEMRKIETEMKKITATPL